MKLSFAVIAALLNLWVSPSSAQSSHDWIHDYEKQSGIDCCGPGDCKDDIQVAEHPDGSYTIFWSGASLLIPRNRVKPSRDGKYWFCGYKDVYDALHERCFFAPPRTT